VFSSLQVREELQAIVRPHDVQHLPGICLLHIGMRVLLYSKDCIRLGLMNGCECVVEHIVFADEECVPDDGELVAGRAHRLQYMPTALLLRSVDAPWQLPIGDLPALPSHITTRRGLFILEPSKADIRRTLSREMKITVTRVQFAVWPADVCTVYGAQGESWNAVIADMAKPPKMSLDLHWLACYVMISRARTLEGLLLLRLATQEELNHGAPSDLRAEVDRLLLLENESTTSLSEYIHALQCSVPQEVKDLFLPNAPAQQLSAVALVRKDAVSVVKRRMTGKRPLSQGCTDEASVQRPRQYHAVLPHRRTAKRQLTLASDESAKRSRVLRDPCAATPSASPIVDEKIIFAEEQAVVDQLVRNEEESTEWMAVDVVPPAHVSSVPAALHSAAATSPESFDEGANDALYDEFFGSRKSTSSEEPPRKAMPRWRQGVLRAVDIVSGCDGDVDVKDKIDDDIIGLTTDVASGEDDGGAGDDDVESERSVVAKPEREGGAAEELRPVEDVEAARSRIITTHENLCAQPNLDICNLVGYTLITPANVDVDHTVCGLNNVGNTCWGNSLLQVLAKIQPLRIWLRQHERIAAVYRDHDGHCCLCYLAGDIRRLTTSVVNEHFTPRYIENRARWNPLFAGVEQQDASEAYITLLQACAKVDEDVLKVLAKEFKEANEPSAKLATPFWWIFGGVLRVDTHCSGCSTTSRRFEVFSNLQLAIPDEERPSVESALAQYTRLEQLPLDDRCELSACGVFGRRSRTESVFRWPLVLTLGIRRQGADLQKISRHISFQLTLAVTGDITYDLRGVVIHHGSSIRAGHYTAYVCSLDGHWFHCNDAMQPQRLTVAQVISVQAYLLVYEKR
jgi:ubiquitin C-terminal hydrolase